MMLATICTLVFIFVSFHDVNSLHLEPRMVDGIKSASSRWEETWQVATTLLSAIAESVRLTRSPNFEPGYTSDSIREMHKKQKSIYTSVSRDIKALHTIFSACNSLMGNLHTGLNHLDELMDILESGLPTNLRNRIQVFYTYQSGAVVSHYASSKLQIRFNRSMNEAVSATNTLLTSLQELKHKLSVN
ncbi:hypothetical protein D915_003916 [Fasciola hepatica]|uniref:Uncharacterized protein n=1 Tax=Fasciola hepatica TaxID=6192 RepID=A0A4E0RCP2_FASHE|nr:hypothetical protein D915_003916 [Fasciola hepatica]